MPCCPSVGLGCGGLELHSWPAMIIATVARSPRTDGIVFGVSDVGGYALVLYFIFDLLLDIVVLFAWLGQPNCACRDILSDGVFDWDGKQSMQ